MLASRASLIESYARIQNILITPLPFGRALSQPILLRTVLLILVTASRNALWVLEQPHGSILVRHRRFDWMVNHVMYALWKHFKFCKPDSPTNLLDSRWLQVPLGLFLQLLDAKTWWQNTQANHGLQLHERYSAFGSGHPYESRT